MQRTFLILCSTLALCACSSNPGFSGAPRSPLDGGPVVATLDGNHQVYRKLSDYRMLAFEDGQLVTNDGVVPYDLNTPLFSDYALKFRTIWVPEGQSGSYTDDGPFEFPVGTVVTKTFSFAADMRKPNENVRLIETRVLLKTETGWVPLPYIWNDEQTDAILTEVGGATDVQFVHTDGTTKKTTYVIPDSNQCQECHGNVDPTDPEQTKVVGLIGPRAKHLNHTYTYDGSGQNQLAVLAERGILSGVPDDLDAEPHLAKWDDASESLERRARAILDANCAHCHNPNGTAAGSTLLLAAEVTDPPSYGVCNPPIRSIDENHPTTFDIDPGNPDASAIVVRFESTEPEVMMPRLGRTLVFEEGVQVVRDWIAAMPGGCN
ncbi:MAG: hypothetical protein D6761_01875 [Candidatus Dadabacteria bacterium]|nr:MAG: hypothetical protein D6761_01875 [Candidatus Dadabacteria bacterium]